MGKPKKKASGSRRTKSKSSDDCDEIEKKCQAIRIENEKLLREFCEWLAAKKLGDSTILGHYKNVDAYINSYLLYSEPIKASEGIDEVSYFFGDWFIRKCLWANPSSMKSLAASLKKFYAFLAEKGQVHQERYKELQETIKYGLPDWLYGLREHDEGENADPMDAIRQLFKRMRMT